MVYLNKLKWKGLFSFRDTNEIDLSNHTIVVGPNNSGKSNILRILKVFVDAFAHNERLDYSKIHIEERNPFLEISLKFSKSETKKLVDFFSFHPDATNSSSEFYEFENYDILLELFDVAIIRLEWTKTVDGDTDEPYARIEFPKTGLKFFGYLFSDFCISNSYPEEHGEKRYSNTIFLKDLLQKIKNKDNVISVVNEFYKQDYNEIGSMYLRINDPKKFSGKSHSTITSLFSFLNIPVRSQRDIRLRTLLGVIFQKGVKISFGSKGLTTRSILDVAEKLRRADHDIMVSTPESDKISFNAVLEQQLFESLLEYDLNLELDGSNLVSFLFSLKNSHRQSDRTKFKNIQEEFNCLFESDQLGFDVILQYGLDDKYGIWRRHGQTPPKIPTIMIQDRNLQRQFGADQVGAGLLETIYLLTLAHGLENSVILLDEPAVNLHPTLMKAMAKSLQNPTRENQFLIVTHSSDLANYEIFDNKASILYIRRKNHHSIVRTLTGETKEWFKEKRHKLKHQIDSRIFFGKSVLLCEGDSDKNFLEGITNSLEYNDEIKLEITQNDVVITHVGGKNTFTKYIDLLKNLDIPYLVLGDSDAKTLFEHEGYGNMNKNDVVFCNYVTILENKNLECLMKDIDLDIYNKAKRENKGSKPAVAFAFAEEVSQTNPEKLKSIQKLLSTSIDLAKGKLIPQTNNLKH